MQPVEALSLTATWSNWQQWSRPGDSFANLARSIIEGRSAMDSERIRHIEGICAGLDVADSFGLDPIVLSRRTRPGLLAVIEGNHRIAAVCLAVLRGKQIGPFTAFLGE